ncbi:MAG: GtrA family protein [Hungatella sp.]|nr:GtrA family protein [Hungatella sp.]
MISKIWKKLANPESVSYVFFGVLTTLIDWGSYRLFRVVGIDYRMATALSWAAAVLFAFVTNKLIVFRSLEMRLSLLWKEFVSFVTCRLATGVLTMVIMVFVVDILHWNEYVGKVLVSMVSLVLNYILSKLIIFKKKVHDGA